MYSCTIFVFMQIFCIAFAGPVKRDGASFDVQPEASVENLPIFIVKLERSSEDTSEEAVEIPVEFPFNLAKSLDEILSLKEMEKPNSQEASGTWINTDAATEADSSFEESIQNDEIKSKENENTKGIEVKDNSKSESVSTESDSSYPLENIELFGKFLDREDKKKAIYKQLKNNEISINDFENEIPRDSFEDELIFDKNEKLKEINGKPIHRTMSIEKINEEKSLSESKEGRKFLSRLLDVISRPFNNMFF